MLEACIGQQYLQQVARELGWYKTDLVVVQEVGKILKRISQPQLKRV